MDVTVREAGLWIPWKFAFALSSRSLRLCAKLIPSNTHGRPITKNQSAKPMFHPLRLDREDELWVLATLPRKGSPRPVALGVKKMGEKGIRPLGLH